jgi:hypothetical protein
MRSVLEKIVEQDLEHLPVLQVTHTESHHGREYQVLQRVSRNVLTDFDRKLSRHLVATKGTGLPAFSVAVEVQEKNGAGGRRQLATAHHPSVPHALREIVHRAFSRSGPVEMTFLRDFQDAGDAAPVKSTRKIDTDTIEMLDAALGTCRHLGEAEFLQISGDLDIVMVTPPGDLKPVIMQLTNGTVSVPNCEPTNTAPFESPLFAFAEQASDSRVAQGYLARARQALTAEKEAAISDFRAAAEQRIRDFDRALSGRPLESHRKTLVQGLVTRLKAGLGDTLSGLSEDARLIALDWCDSVDSAANLTPIRSAV